MTLSNSEHNFCNNPLVTPTQSLHAAVKASKPSDNQWGVDTVSIGFAINDDLLSMHDPVWKVGSYFDQSSGKSSETLKTSIWVGHSHVRVTVWLDFHRCKLEFNAPQVEHMKSARLTKPNDLEGVVEQVLTGIEHLVHGSFDYLDNSSGEICRDPNWTKNVSFNRLDLARNLLIEPITSLPSLKLAIEQTIPRNMRHTSKHKSKKGGWSAYNSTSRSGCDVIYDKHAELNTHKVHEPVPMGTLRFETQLKGNRLKQPVYIKTLDQLTDETAWAALENRWKACKWGVSLSEPNTIYQATDHLSICLQESIIGFLNMVANGQTHRMDARHYSSMTKRAVELGLTPGVPTDQLGVATAYLDLKTGALVQIEPNSPTTT